MYIIRWAAGFIAQPHVKKSLKVEKYLKLPNDPTATPSEGMTAEQFKAQVKRNEDSANNR